ncbi:hypothetical protein [Bermanella marisrubri]|uniref:Lipoprotein n=1 Tax=Bermanella marisrubri TaxID=207949 RepID=Q1N501_9GAMM|nr:hypothetical protein [Bermanella marisrubri]EAT13277.1 hypothetical protein RED65_00915 [Oceanobacter sp. RED65] [Bermanella marisrubri]
MIRFVVIFVLTTIVSACDRVVPPTLTMEAETYRKYLVHYDPDNIKKEQWDDPEIMSTPRIQFTWVEPHLEDNISNLSLWSIKPDGTDLRLVATPEELMPAHLEQSRYRGEVPFVRSPDNRYVAYAMAHGIYYERRLLDLKTKEVIVMDRRGGPPNFMWFKGGRYLTFSGTGSLVQYDMESQETKYIADRFGKNYIHRAFAYDNGNQMVDIQDGVATFYDFDTGKVLKEIPNTHGVLTLDGKHWIKEGKGFDTYATSVLEPDKVAYEYPTGMVRSSLQAISADGIIVSGGVRVVTHKHDKIMVFRLPGDGYIANTALYNTRPFLESGYSLPESE